MRPLKSLTGEKEAQPLKRQCFFLQVKARLLSMTAQTRFRSGSAVILFAIAHPLQKKNRN
jgi:hypothetical protein